MNEHCQDIAYKELKPFLERDIVVQSIWCQDIAYKELKLDLFRELTLGLTSSQDIAYKELKLFDGFPSAGYDVTYAKTLPIRN